MKLNNIIKGGAIALALFLCSCSVQKRAQRHLARAIELDPTILVAEIDSVEVPTIQLDTVYNIQYDTLTIETDIDSLINTLVNDSCIEEAKKLITPIVEYVTTYTFLDDTISISDTITTDSLRLSLRTDVWQSGDSIMIKTELANGVVLFDYNYIVPPEDTYLNKTQEVILFLILLLVILFSGFLLKNLIK